MIKSTVIVKPKTRSQSHQPLPVFATRKLAGFAAQAIFLDSSQSQTRTALGSETGTRYRYIDDTQLVPMTEAGKANGTNAASSASGAKTRSRPNNEYVLYSYGKPVAMTNDSGTSYFGTDILGSVRSVTDKYGTVQADYSYDAFGSPYLGNLENNVGFGYCGKVYDNGTGLYDYGFRDYSPVSARFTTVDPIRDGSNWFSYVVNDPVNYVDLFGLQCESASDNDQNRYKSDPSEPLTTGGSVDMYSSKREALIKKNTTSAIEKAVENHIEDKYFYGTKEKNFIDHYRCDNFDETVIDEAGGEPLNYLAGKASTTSTSQHIDNYMKNGGIESKKMNATVLADGAHTVFMDNSNVIDSDTGKPLAPHTGMIIKDGNGVKYIDNNSKNITGGVQIREYDSEQAFQKDYGYQSFYYQEIRIENPENLTENEIYNNKQLIEEMFQ